MVIKEERKEGFIVVRPEGRLDTMNYPALEELLSELFERGEKNILMNFTSIDYISSSGLRVLLMALKRTKAEDGRMALCCILPGIREVFDISGFSSIFRIYDSAEEAEASFR